MNRRRAEWNSRVSRTASDRIVQIARDISHTKTSILGRPTEDAEIHIVQGRGSCSQKEGGSGDKEEEERMGRTLLRRISLF